MSETLIHIICLIANALDMFGLYPGDVNEVSVSWRGRGTETTYRVKVGNYTYGVRLEQEV